MIYQRADPAENLQEYVRSFWWIDSEGDPAENIQKIIPDGYPELIFHYEDPFQINLGNGWDNQEKLLLAGQMSRYFYLRNTGNTGVFAIKFMPWAVHDLFGIKMDELVNSVVPFRPPLIVIEPPTSLSDPGISFSEKMERSSEWILQIAEECDSSRIRNAIKILIKENGMMPTIELLEGMSERTMERHFRNVIGLPPKFYARIIRLSYIFKLVNKDFNWSDLTFLGGFYDQSHFIRDFKEFTGEEPSRYGFTEQNMANFFLIP